MGSAPAPPRLLLPLLAVLLLPLGLRSAAPTRPPAPPPADGPLEPRHLAIVVNEADPLSLRAGAYYQRRRGIPADQVIRVRMPADRPELPPARFAAVYRQVRRRTPPHVQVYALAWTRPWRVGCRSITDAFARGPLPQDCRDTCQVIRRSPLYGRFDLHRPHDRLGMRPAMLLAGRDWDAVRALIDRGITADGTAPPGTAYLLDTSDPARNVRAATYGWIRRWLGHRLRIVVLTMDELRDADDVIVLVTGLERVQGIASNRFRPGAVADHLTSFGGQLLGGGQTSALEWLQAGATGSYGTVVEPCNRRGKFPDPVVLITAYLGGDTLVEAYWKSVAMPGQGVFVGEPLARPWPPARGLRPDPPSSR
jgi:uncharacterized protein (TIGR03790 family)